MEIKISESQFRKLIKEDISSCNDELFKKLNNRYILNIFRKSIEAMVNPHIQNWNGDREKYKEILTLIGKDPSIQDSILDMKFVYDDNGNWTRLNKLNTNYSDTAKFVVDVLDNEGYDLCEISKAFDNNDKSKLNELSLKIQNNSEKYYREYLEPNVEKYTENNTRNTRIGDRAEQDVVDYLTNNYRWTLIYQATEGSPIDTKLGIDLIMRTKDGRIAKIQVKTVGSITKVAKTPCEEDGTEFTHKKQKGGYMIYSRGGVAIRPNEINLVAYVTTKGKLLLVKKYMPVSVVGMKCVDTPVNQFPSNPRGSFYVDHESVVTTNI
jgi:hypothetical protein